MKKFPTLRRLKGHFICVWGVSGSIPDGGHRETHIVVFTSPLKYAESISIEYVSCRFSWTRQYRYANSRSQPEITHFLLVFSFYELSLGLAAATGYDEAPRAVIANFPLPGTKFTSKVTYGLKVSSAVAFRWPCGLHGTCATAGFCVCVCFVKVRQTGVGAIVS
jgi:hypothetical protein